jgi:diaminopimelate epimerase
MKYSKYHGLGNDYIVLDPSNGISLPSEDEIKTICHRNFGVGSDGILFGPFEEKGSPFSLRIFNPDGSEAEKSGNGLRIFSRYLWDTKRVHREPFSIITKGGKVSSQLLENGRLIKVEMGKVSFSKNDIPVRVDSEEVINEDLTVDGREFIFNGATIGNPHCVIVQDDISKDQAIRYGEIIETMDIFPNRTNVQFMKILDRNNIAIEIWERGAGYTLASGSSSSASGAVARKLGLCDRDITVHMPGGEIQLEVENDYSVAMTGPVIKVCDGTIDNEMFSALL